MHAQNQCPSRRRGRESFLRLVAKARRPSILFAFERWLSKAQEKTPDPLGCASRATRAATTTRIVLGLLLLLWSAGCARLQELGPSASKQPPTGEVTRVEALWHESGVQGRNVLARGFAGRIYLFGRGDAPILAPGELSVYTFDDDDMTAKPKYVWKFKSEDLEKVADKTMLGWSYTLWIPWDRGEEAKNCTLIVRYRSPQGRVVASTPGRVLLPPLPGGGDQDKRAAQATANAPVSVTS